MRYPLGLLSGGIAALDHRLIAPNLSGSGETISTTRSWRVGRGVVKRRATPSLRNLLAGLRWPRSIPSKTARNPEISEIIMKINDLRELHDSSPQRARRHTKEKRGRSTRPQCLGRTATQGAQRKKSPSSRSLQPAAASSVLAFSSRSSRVPPHCKMSKISAYHRAHVNTVTLFAGNANYFVKYILGRRCPAEGQGQGWFMRANGKD